MKYYLCLLVCLFSFVNNVYAEGIEFLPANNLFEAPIADPRWPKFLMGLSRDYKNSYGKQLWNFNFGENIGLAKFGDKDNPYEFGVQAAVFGVMDIHSVPTRLVNADYFAAFGLSHRRGDYHHLFQLSHVSAHLGDEFLLSDQGKNLARINLSYETLKWFIRYKPNKRFSPYMSAGYVLHVDPAHMKRLVLAVGADYWSSRIILKDSTRLIAGAYVNSWQQNRYRPTVCLRGGLQYERTKYCDRCLQLLVEYKFGKSQAGQFYNRNIRQIGILIAFSS